MSIASEISRLLQAKADIKIAIEGKGVTVSGSATLDDYSDLIDAIQQGSGGGGGASSGDDVRFLDYDGTILHSYSASDFLALTEMPENPSHEGLTAQGWNWTLADAKEQVQAMGTCDIGQLYVTDDGKTRIYIELKERRSLYLCLYPKGTVEIDWGDGSGNSTLTGSSFDTAKYISHAYGSAGSYVITLSTEGTFGIKGSGTSSALLSKSASNPTVETAVYANAIKKVECGHSVVILGFAFNKCYSLESISVANDTSIQGGHCFENCYSLTGFVFNTNSTALLSNTFQNCYSLARVSTSKQMTEIQTIAFDGCYLLDRFSINQESSSALSSTFKNCRSIKSIKLPDGMHSLGSYTFQNCNALQEINIPDGVTSISYYAFSGCNTLKKITIPDGVTELSYNTFQNCNCLEEINIPDGITKIGNYLFSYCSSLREINIPDGVTSIGTYSFSNCTGLSEIIIPAGVTSIGNNAFNGNTGMKAYHFLSTTPPTLGGTAVFTSIPSDCKIYVPAESLSAYKTADKWSTHASKMVGE